MIKVYAKLDCGCCTEELMFESEEDAKKAFDSVGFGNGMTVVDGFGVAHEGLDTFYGFSVEEEEQGKKSLSYLFDLVTGK